MSSQQAKLEQLAKKILHDKCLEAATKWMQLRNEGKTKKFKGNPNGLLTRNAQDIISGAKHPIKNVKSLSELLKKTLIEGTKLEIPPETITNLLRKERWRKPKGNISNWRENIQNGCLATAIYWLGGNFMPRDQLTRDAQAITGLVGLQKTQVTQYYRKMR